METDNVIKEEQSQEVLAASNSEEIEVVTPDGIEELKEEIREEVREEIVLTAQQFSGPLPPPEILAGYEEVLPGAAERIMSMAERQASHRQKTETERLRLAGRDGKMGILCGFFIAFAGVLGGVILIAFNPQSVGAIIGGSVISGTSMLGIVSTFVTGVRDKGKKTEK